MAKKPITPPKSPAKFGTIQADDASIDVLAQWWQENGKYMIAGAVLGIVVMGSWKGWEYYVEFMSAQASDHYEMLHYYVALEQEADALEQLNIIKDDYKVTTYPELASLLMARFRIERGELEIAAENLQWVAENSEHWVLQALAYVRLARVLLELDRPKEARDILLEQAFPEGIDQLGQEVYGDYLAQQGELDQAGDAYYRAVSKSVQDDYSFIMMKLQEIGKLKN